MTADLVLRQPDEPVPDAAASLVRWAQAASAAHTLAQSLVKTSFVPQRYRNKPDEATAAILAGAELGLSPLAALRAFDDISGTVAPKAVTLVAVAQSHGHHIDVTAESDEAATVRYRRRGEREWRTVTYSVTDAQRAGLVGRNPNWRTQPRNMCVARAQSIAARRVASDAILGIAYSAEELADADPAEQPTTARVTMDELTARDPAPEPEPEPEVVDERPATQRQLGAVIGLLRDLGVEEDEHQRAWLAAELGRDVDSRRTLTRAEAAHVHRVVAALIAERGALPDPEDQT
ncbi:MAG: hypothetical protein ACJ768_25515 [Gaiellaceae bacterium]